jgi:hypothetical protein
LLHDTHGDYITKKSVKLLQEWDHFFVEIYDEKFEVELIKNIT